MKKIKRKSKILYTTKICSNKKKKTWQMYAQNSDILCKKKTNKNE